MDVRFGMFNVRSLYRAGSLVTVSKVLWGSAHTHGNVRVDPERPVAVLDRMKSTVVSVDAVSRTRTECSRGP
jgi:hypothetical protein